MVKQREGSNHELLFPLLSIFGPFELQFQQLTVTVIHILCNHLSLSSLIMHDVCEIY